MESTEEFRQRVRDKHLNHYLRFGRVSWTESIPHEKPTCIACMEDGKGPTFLNLYKVFEGENKRLWQCWGCGSIIYDGEPEYRSLSHEEQEAIEAEILRYLETLSPMEELELRRSIAKNSITIRDV